MTATTGVKLPVHVYNDFFINCLDNHLIGLLVQRDESFRKAVCSLKTTYSMLTPKPHWIGRESELPQNFYQQGWFLMQVDFEHLKLDDWFVRTTVDVGAYQDIHQAIQEQLKQGQYVLVLLDRFYFPRGIEYMKSHRIHSSFIYGYDEAAKVYHLVEDCVQFGVMAHYDLSFENLEISYKAVLEEDPSFIEGTYALRLNEEREFSYSLPRDVILQNVKFSLEETVEEQLEDFEGNELLMRRTGLACIPTFADMVGDVYQGLGDEYVHQFIPAGRPLQVQRKNLLTLHYLEQDGFFRDEQEYAGLVAGYQELFGKWEVYRNRLFKYILMRAKYPNSKVSMIDFGEVQKLMHEIAPLEREMTERFYGVLSR